MNRVRNAFNLDRLGVPRPRGDEPGLVRLREMRFECSPPTRG